jgi:hypothetical protein
MILTFSVNPYDKKKIADAAHAYERADRMRKPSPLVPPLKERTHQLSHETMIRRSGGDFPFFVPLATIVFRTSSSAGSAASASLTSAERLRLRALDAL